jgi:hypothetical protein
MRKWIISCFIAGFLGAALFYFPYASTQYQFLCPLCPNITSVWGTPLLRFARFTLFLGPLNGAFAAIVGFVLVRALSWVKRTLARQPFQ